MYKYKKPIEISYSSKNIIKSYMLGFYKDIGCKFLPDFIIRLDFGCLEFINDDWEWTPDWCKECLIL